MSFSIATFLLKATNKVLMFPEAFNKFLKTKDAPWKYQGTSRLSTKMSSKNAIFGNSFPVKELFIVSWKEIGLIQA